MSHPEHPEETPHAHDQAAEVAHAWHHFRDNAKFFACFLGVILLTVLSALIDFGPTGNVVAIFFFAAARCALIAYFMASLFKPFSFVTWTFSFCALFLAGMVFLSWWDSTLRGIGNPIKDSAMVQPAPK